MLEASETRRRFVVEDGKMKCNLAGRTRGKRCGSTLMIDGSITCSAGHKFTLDELVVATLDGKPEPLIARSVLASVNQQYELAHELAEAAFKEKFSPPFSMPVTKITGSEQDRIYHWIDDNPWEFSMLLQLADWGHTQYAEALRQMYVARSARGEIVGNALRKLQQETENGDFHSQMLRDHLIDCARRSWYAVTVNKMTTQYYMLVEALKVNGNTDLLWLYEDSLRELSMIRREPRWHPIIFECDDQKSRRMIFRLYRRRPKVDPEIVDGQLFIRLYNNGHVEFKAYSGMMYDKDPAPEPRALEAAAKRALSEYNGLDGDFFRVDHGDLRPKNLESLSEQHWQLKAVADLRQWLCRLQVDPNS
jgi:hypothetical protein